MTNHIALGSTAAPASQRPFDLNATGANTTVHSGPEKIQIGRFSTGMERLDATLRVGRFSDGQTPPLTLSPNELGSFADGLVARPDAAARSRVGSFGNGSNAGAASRSASRRRPTDAAPAHAQGPAAPGHARRSEAHLRAASHRRE